LEQFAMTIAIEVSPGTDAWLERKANTSGADKASVASRVLDQAAEKDLSPVPHSPEERLQQFRSWVVTVPARPGPTVDTDRETIYD
jgi:hypothetical protein